MITNSIEKSFLLNILLDSRMLGLLKIDNFYYP